MTSIGLMSDSSTWASVFSSKTQLLLKRQLQLVQWMTEGCGHAKGRHH